MKFWALALVGALIYARKKEDRMSYLSHSKEEIEELVARYGLDDDMFFGLHEEAKALIERLLNALENRNADDYVERIRAEYSL